MSFLSSSRWELPVRKLPGSGDPREFGLSCGFHLDLNVPPQAHILNLNHQLVVLSQEAVEPLGDGARPAEVARQGWVFEGFPYSPFFPCSQVFCVVSSLHRTFLQPCCPCCDEP